MGVCLAPRAAAFEERIDGAVCYDVMFDLQAAFERNLPPAAEWPGKVDGVSGQAATGKAPGRVNLIGENPGSHAGIAVDDFSGFFLVRCEYA